MIIVDITDAKDDLSKLLESIENGTETEVIIERDGRPVARLLPITTGRRRLGLANGKYANMTLEQFNATTKRFDGCSRMARSFRKTTSRQPSKGDRHRHCDCCFVTTPASSPGS